MSKFIALSPEELEAFVKQAVDAAIAAKQAENEVMTLEEATKFLRYDNPQTLSRKLEEENIPAHRIPQLRFIRSELMEWLAKKPRTAQKKAS